MYSKIANVLIDLRDPGTVKAKLMWLTSKSKIRSKMNLNCNCIGGSGYGNDFIRIVFILSVVILSRYAFAANHTKRFDGNDISQGGDDDSNDDKKDIGWTNINKEVDMALQMIWPVMIRQGYTNIRLPDRTESISVKPLFLTYTTRLRLTNGLLYNIEGISRDGDAMMTYHNKSFQFRANLAVRSVEFVYDYSLNMMGLELYGKIGGAVLKAIVTGDFSISVEDANIRLNNFRILSLGNIEIRLKYDSIMKQLSVSILNPITDLFRDRIVALISNAVRKRIEELIEDINRNDRLHFKEFGRITLGGLTG